MMTMSQTLITSGKRKQIVRFLEDGLDKFELDDPAAQRVIERGGELQEGLRRLLAELSVSDRYANEEVASTYGYLSGYTTPKPIVDQVRLLKELFPELAESTFDESVATCDLTTDAEGYFAIPRWQKVALTYGEAVQKVLDLIKQARDGKFHNYREGKLGPGHLRQHARTVERFQQLSDQQEGHDVLVVSCQFGIRHRGRSVRRAREVMTANEFGLDAFSVGIMLLTHPERLQHYNDLWLDCPGDEYSPDADGAFCQAPYFRFDDGRVKFGTSVVDDADANGISWLALIRHPRYIVC
jgi:hypothetical protein